MQHRDCVSTALFHVYSCYLRYILHIITITYKQHLLLVSHYIFRIRQHRSTWFFTHPFGISHNLPELYLAIYSSNLFVRASIWEIIPSNKFKFKTHTANNSYCAKAVFQKMVWETLFFSRILYGIARMVLIAFYVICGRKWCCIRSHGVRGFFYLVSSLCCN